MKPPAWLVAMLVAALVFGAVLAVFFRDWVREQIVVPMTFFFWVIGLLLRSVDQQVYWAILIIAGAIIAFSVLWPGMPAPADREPSQRRSSSVSRYRQWYTYIDNMENSAFSGDSLARELVRLTVNILAYQQNMSSDEIYRQIDNAEIALPEDFLAFLRRRGFVNKPTPQPAWLDLVNRILRRKPPVRPPDQLSALEKEVESILVHIEALLTPQEHPLEVALEQPAHINHS